MEREAAAYLATLGYTARRNRQHDGKLEPDIAIEEAPPFWCEVKGVKAFRPWLKQASDWIDQCTDECLSGRRPFVLAKVHGTKSWGMGWRDPFGRRFWVFGDDDIKAKLDEWNSS